MSDQQHYDLLYSREELEARLGEYNATYPYIADLYKQHGNTVEFIKAVTKRYGNTPEVRVDADEYCHLQWLYS